MAGMFLEPLPAVLKAINRRPEDEDEPVLLLGYIGEDRLMYCEVDGTISAGPMEWFAVDYRYDPETGFWEDPYAPAPPAEEDVDDDEE